MKKVLYIVNIWGNGGIEKVVSTYCELLKNDYSIYILALEMRESVFTDDLKRKGVIFLNHGIQICGNPIKKQRIRRNIIVNTVKNNNFDIIHYHNSIAISFSYLRSVKRISPHSALILHSHGDNAEAPLLLLKKIYNYVAKNLYKNIPDYNVACSEAAGKWLFAKQKYNSNRYITLPNAFNTHRYCFDIKKRNNFRKNYDIEGKLVIGTIGRFCYQKNPEFILEILKGLQSTDLDYIFVWVGNGPQYEQVKERAKELGVSQRIVYIESTDDVPTLLSGIDVFILPSRYEGLGLVLLEAQSAGLHSIASENITRETKLTDYISFLPIDSSSRWVKEICRIQKSIPYNDDATLCISRRYPEEEIENSQFNIYDLEKKIKQLYLDVLK